MLTSNNTNIPDSLIQSLRDDNLVIFVGAGVSACAYPYLRKKPESFYPNFKELVDQIAKELDHTFTKEENLQKKQGLYDRILGEWDAQYLNLSIKQIASIILNKDFDKKRIELHKKIVQLFLNESTLRIVTTNFDLLLDKAISEITGEKNKIKRTVAPTLPPGRNFKGLVYLHGTVDESEGLILTDKDIGRAYMDEGWALRFAHEMFSNYTVLFIGYSLEDPPLRYLSLALESTNQEKHWAFVPETTKTDVVKESLNWNRRGVKPIWYKVVRNDFRILESDLNEWIGEIQISYIDKRNWMYQFTESDPVHLLPHELDKMRYYCNNVNLLRDFIKSDIDIHWFDKLLEWGKLDTVLMNKKEMIQVDYYISERIVKWLYANSPEKICILKLENFKEKLSPTLYSEFCILLEKKELKINDEYLIQLLELFKPSVEKNLYRFPHLWIEKLIKRLINNNNIIDAVWLFSMIMKSSTKIKKSPKSFLDEKSSTDEFDLSIEIDFVDHTVAHNIRDFVAAVIIPNISKIGYILIQTLSIEYLKLINSVNKFEGKSFSRSYRRTIQEKPSLHRHNVDDTYIDILRDTIEELIKNDLSKALNIIKFWSEIDENIFSRLAIHALRHTLEYTKGTDIDDSLLMKFLESDYLWKYDILHDMYLFIAAIYKFKLDYRNRIANLILDGPPKKQRIDSDRFEDYRSTLVFNYLYYINKFGYKLSPKLNKPYNEYKIKNKNWKYHIDDLDRSFTIEVLHPTLFKQHNLT